MQQESSQIITLLIRLFSGDHLDAHAVDKRNTAQEMRYFMEMVLIERNPMCLTFELLGAVYLQKVWDDLRKCWEDKGYEGVFLGYDKVCPGTWKIFKLNTAQFVNTKDVDFDENLQAKEVKLMLAVSRGVHEKLRYTIESNYHYTLFRD